MARSLPSSYAWQTPVTLSTLLVAGCIVLLAVRGVAGWVPVAALLLLAWAGHLALVWTRTRAAMTVAGPLLRVRHVRAFCDVRAGSVTAVSQFLTRRGPSYKLTVQEDDGRRRRQVVPVALLTGGHSTLFTWILTWAPQATLDKGSLKTVEQLKVRGLIE